MPTSAHGNPTTPPGIVKKFKVGDITYVYNYNHPLFCYQQASMATAVYQYQIDRKKKQASNSIYEYMATQSGNYNVWVLSYLLLKELPNGELEPFKLNPNVMEWENSDVFKFVAALPMEHESGVEEVIEDFFSKPSRYMIGSILRGEITKDFVKNIASLSHDMMQRQQEALDFLTLINPPSSSDVSSKLEAEATSGSSPEGTQASSTMPAA